ncbi:serine hydrolase domain-containing protein [Actinoplanes sp. NPDC051343]|uniref:serine hydrolase domain-containing protein n=1 Tax=Actinoplanes sp. NPDC051343 TaxID=3363906 RepID=UPI00378C15FD
MPLLPKLQSWLDEAASRHGIPGAAVAVGHGDALAEAATGVINRNTGVATTPETVFQIGSVTKILTAVLVMQLVDDGLIELDQPVRRYLPQFALINPEATETVTVRQLLLHVGGFDGDVEQDTGRGDEALDRYLAFLGGHARQVSPPGALFSYSNSGYAVLGALAAHRRGGTWESVLRQRLIEPLGARHMALLAEEAILFRAAAGHEGPAGETVPVWQEPRSLGPAGATPCAAPRDLVRLGRMFLAGGVSAGGTRLLSRRSVDAMISPQLTEPGVPQRGAHRRGLGPVLFDWEGTAAYGHDGDVAGQCTQWRVVPGHDLVIAMSANHQASVVFFDELLDRIVRELTGVTVPPRATPPGGPPTPGPARFSGRYSTPLHAYEVTATDDGLDVTTIPVDGSATTTRYVAFSGSTFIAAHPDLGVHWTVTFLDDGRYLHTGRAAAREV